MNEMQRISEKVGIKDTPAQPKVSAKPSSPAPQAPMPNGLEPDDKDKGKKEDPKKAADEGVKNLSKAEIEKLAQDVAKQLGGKISPAKGEGHIIKIPNAKNEITIRIMEGGGKRSEPYYRISKEIGGSVDAAGKNCNNRLLTHLELNSNSYAEIMEIISKIRGV